MVYVKKILVFRTRKSYIVQLIKLFICSVTPKSAGEKTLFLLIGMGLDL
jgi:hypothetical protein